MKYSHLCFVPFYDGIDLNFYYPLWHLAQSFTHNAFMPITNFLGYVPLWHLQFSDDLPKNQHGEIDRFSK